MQKTWLQQFYYNKTMVNFHKGVSQQIPNLKWPLNKANIK